MISRLIRIFGAIDNLMYSSKNIVKVIEEVGQFDYVLKKLFKVHKEYYLLLEEKDNLQSEE